MGQSVIPDQAEEERRRLEIEYRELCNDWWQRDKNVLDKFTGVSTFFIALLGLIAGVMQSNIQLGSNWIMLFLPGFGAIYSLILLISVVKDTLYRDGTEALLIRLATRLHIRDYLLDLQNQKKPDGSNFYDGIKFQSLVSSRKVKISPEKSSLNWMWGRLRELIEKRGTFRWIMFFYLISFGFFTITFLVTLGNWIWHLFPTITFIYTMVNLICQFILS